jgi:putative intracellular protease/amidase
MPRTIGIVLFPGVEELDFVGPWEIFSMTAVLATDACTVFTAQGRSLNLRHYLRSQTGSWSTVAVALPVGC